jgi:hypothetical protein
MLPFEDRFSRQRRLAEVGAEGQRQLSTTLVRLSSHEDVDVEWDYLARAGVTEVRLDSEAEVLTFPFASCFEFAGPRSLASGAWCALARIRRVLSGGSPR